MPRSGNERVDDSHHHLLELLTAREWEVVELLIQEYDSAEIADRLQISPRTIEVHRHHIFDKLRVRTPLGVLRLIVVAGKFKSIPPAKLNGENFT